MPGFTRDRATTAGTEPGAVQGDIVGIYLHGPVLPSSPLFADELFARALAGMTGRAPLPPLDHRIELAAAESLDGLGSWL